MTTCRMDNERKKMDRFWTMRRRSWLYSIMVSLVPLLVAIGVLTGDVVQMVLNVVAAVLAVGGGSMALSNLTPDNVFKVGVQVEEDSGQ